MLCCGADEKQRVLRSQSRSDDPSWLPSVPGMSTMFGMGSGPTLGSEKQAKRWDVVLVSETVELSAAEKELDELERQQLLADRQSTEAQRKEVYVSLRAVGLRLHTFVERPAEGEPEKVPTRYVLISVPDDLMHETAEAIGLEKRLKPLENEPAETVAYDEYTMSKRDLFAKDKNNAAYFTSLERLQCCFHLIESPEYEKPRCAGIDLDKLVSEKVFNSYFCMDDKERLEDLKENWVNGSTLRKPPVNEIRDYLGEKIALYFAWVHLYTSWLGTLGLLSLVPFIYSLTWTESPTGTPYDNWAMPVYGLLSMIWAQLFLEAWKREQATYAYLWHIEDFEDEEALRPEYRRYVLQQKREWEFRNPAHTTTKQAWYDAIVDPKKGDKKKGQWSSVGFVPVRKDDDPLLLSNTQEVEWFNPRLRYWRLFVTTMIGLVLVSLIALVTIMLQAMKQYIRLAGGPLYADFSQLIAAFAQSVFITIMSFVWSKVGVVINDWEMHRTDTQWEDSLMMKTFSFQFINSFGPAFYIAFVQGNVAIPILHVADPVTGETVPLVDHCLDDMCYKAIYLQMLIIILSKQVSRNLLAIGPPAYQYIKSKCFKPAQSEEKVGLHRAVLRQAKLAAFQGTYMEYIEMAIQFGYVSIFAVAFPIGSIVCWLNNLLEKRTDALKIAVLVQRPRYLGTQDIGSMQGILEFVALISVFANCGILYLSSEAYYGYFPLSWGERPNFKVFVFTVVLEHVILMMKSVVAALVPDTPAWVSVEKTRGLMRKRAYDLAHLSQDAQERRARVQEARKQATWKDDDMDEDEDVF